VIAIASHPGASTRDLCRKHGISPNTFYAWRKKFGGMEVDDAKRLRRLEEESRQLKQLVAELTLDKKALQRQSSSFQLRRSMAKQTAMPEIMNKMGIRQTLIMAIGIQRLFRDSSFWMKKKCLAHG
jgi:putative transposase